MRWYGVLNIFGLSIAFTANLFIGSYLYQELSYDRFHDHAERIHRVTYLVEGQEGFRTHFARIPVDYVNELPAEIPGIQRLVRFQNHEQKYLRIGQDRYRPRHAYVTDAEVFEVFDFALFQGDVRSALSSPYSVVLTKSAANTYFGRTDVLGEEIVVTGEWTPEEQIYRVTGILDDVPVNSHMPVDMFFSFVNEEERTGWAYVYLLLSPGADGREIETMIDAFVQDHSDTQTGLEISMILQPLTTIHLHSHLARELQPNGRSVYVKLLFWVSLAIWLIALINFSNLKTAQILGRIKDFGVRRVLGATRWQLGLNTLLGVTSQSFIAMLMATLLYVIIWPLMQVWIDDLVFPPMYLLLPFILVLGLLTGVLAGIFPLFITVSMRITELLEKGRTWSLQLIHSSNKIRKPLVFIQFSAAIALLAGTFFAHQQINYLYTKNLGITTDQILTIKEVPYAVIKGYKSFKNQIMGVPGVISVSACMQLPSTEIRDVGPVDVQGRKQQVSEKSMMDMQIIDPDFIDMMGLEIIAGEDFTRHLDLGSVPEFNQEFTALDYLGTAPRKYFINETAMHQLGWQNPDQAIGTPINWSIGNYKLAHGPIAGVIKDYHQESLKNKIDPTLMTVEPIWLSNFLIKIETANLESTLEELEKAWNKQFHYPFEFSFLDDEYDQLYHGDQVQIRLLSTLTALAIFVSLVGLISLVALALRTRAKELAIRRVMGANLPSLTFLIGREYLGILIISFCLGVPVSYYWIQIWLDNFAYRIVPTPIGFLMVLIIMACLIGLLTLFQTFNATRTSPIKYLSED